MSKASSTTSNKSKKNTKSRNKNELTFNKEIVGIIIITIGIFTLVSLYFKDGILGSLIYEFLYNFTGIGSYLIPYLVMIIGVLYVLNRLNISENKKSIIIILLYLSLLIFLSRFFDNGGKIGKYFSDLFIRIFGVIGSLTILFSTILILILMLTEISFTKMIKKLFIKFNSRKISNNDNKTNEINIKIYNENNEKETDLNINNKNKKKLIDEKIKILDYTKNLDSEVINRINNEEENNDITKKENDKLIGNYIEFTDRDSYEDFLLPSTEILDKDISKFNENDKKEILDNARKLENILTNFGINAEVIEISKGPTITRYELQPAPGIKVSKIVNLSNDIALGLAASDVRIEAPIPGKSAIGIEVPNSSKAIVRFRDVLESKEYKDAISKLSFAIGKDIAGKTVVANIEAMPHLLVAGATGSGKSVCINTIICSVLFKAKPDEVKLMLIDPKVVELSVYNGIPHLLTPVITDPKKASGALNWAVQEMTRRYKLFAKLGVRDFKSYNTKINDEEGNEKLSQILIIIDELADLMMVSPTEVEESICRIAQMARAAGIHLILATQRPSVDVITGTIKANIPSRLAFAVSSQADSRTILDMSGAEKLLGKGDMLFYPVGESKPKRIQGAFISDKEVEDLVDYLKKQSEAKYEEKIVKEINENLEKSFDDNVDELFTEAVRLIVDEGQASISFLQRKLKIGYSRAARIVDEMEQKGIVGGHEGSKPRKVLIGSDDLDKILNRG